MPAGAPGVLDGAALGVVPGLCAIAGPASAVAPITAAATKTTVLRTLAPFTFPSLTTDKTRRVRRGCVLSSVEIVVAHQLAPGLGDRARQRRVHRKCQCQVVHCELVLDGERDG